MLLNPFYLCILDESKNRNKHFCSFRLSVWMNFHMSPSSVSTTSSIGWSLGFLLPMPMWCWDSHANSTVHSTIRKFTMTFESCSQPSTPRQWIAQQPRWLHMLSKKTLVNQTHSVPSVAVWKTNVINWTAGITQNASI